MKAGVFYDRRRAAFRRAGDEIPLASGTKPGDTGGL